MFNALHQQPSKVKIFQVHSRQIDDIAKFIESSQQLNAIKGTMAIHQLVVPAEGELHHRKLACFCNGTTPTHFCACHKPIKVDVPSTNYFTNPATTKPSTSALERMEATLSETQISLFKKRLEEGYDLIVDDLSTLDPAKRTEYLLWKTWRSAKLIDHDEEPKLYDSSGDDSEPGDKDDPDDLWLPPGQRSSPQTLKVGKYYAVFFTKRKKKTYYIGCPVSSSDSDEIEMKFLEKKLIGSRFVYDWPKRPDLCTIEKSAILEEVKFHGPPPYHLRQEVLNALNEKAKAFKLM